MPNYPQIVGPLPGPGNIDCCKTRLYSHNQDAIRCQDINAMPGRGYYVALTGNLDSIRDIIDSEIDGTAVGQSCAGFIEVVGIDCPLLGFVIPNVRDMVNVGVNGSYTRAGIRKIKGLAVRRKSDAVRFVEAVLDNGHETRDGIKAVYRRIDLRSFGIEPTRSTVICVEDGQRNCNLLYYF